MNPKWDYISWFCLIALGSGLLLVPCATLIGLINWLRAPAQDKLSARDSFIGWGIAFVLLLSGFAIIFRSVGFAFIFEYE